MFVLIPMWRILPKKKIHNVRELVSMCYNVSICQTKFQTIMQRSKGKKKHSPNQERNLEVFRTVKEV